MYLDYFSLERHPFRITPDTSLFFSGGDEGRGVVLEAMLYAIATGEGILKVVGEVGSGKTMLCRMLEERLPETTEIVYLANPNLSPDEILYAVAFELKLPVRRDTSKLLVMQQLQNYLLRQHAANRKVLVVIEEAQGMPVETLEEIRLFSNLETHRDKLMQIILFGQPELDKNLSARNIRQLRERITHSFNLNPLSSNDVAHYIRFRLSAAGCPCPQLFSPGAEWLIAKAASGLSRRVNILADKALLAAFAGNVREGEAALTESSAPAIKVKHVIAAIQDSEYSASVLHSLVSPLRLLGASMLIVLITVILLWPETSGMASQTTLLLPAPAAEQIAAEAVSENAVGEQSLIMAEVRPIPNKPEITPLPIANSPQPLLTDDYLDADVLPRTGDAAVLHNVTAEPLEQEAALLATTVYNSGENPLNALAPFSVRSLLQERVLASIPWLHKAAGNGYTVQFMSGETNNLDFAEAFLQTLRESNLLDQTYVCMSSASSGSYWTIKYGSFTGINAAENFVSKLPSHIKSYGPFVQNISSVVCNTNNTIAALMLE